VINEAIIIQELFGLVGFRDSTITGYDIVDATNQESDSGLIFQDGYKLVTIKNIHETQEDVEISEVNFNTYLTNLQNSCIIDVCKKITNKKSGVIESNTLFPYEQTFENTENVSSGFIGIKIKPSLNERLLLKVNAITAAFDSAITLAVKLMNSETGTEIYTQDITTVDKQQVKQIVNWNISLNRSGITGGSYYLGYYVSDLSGAKPYKRDYENASSFLPSSKFYMEFRNNTVTGTRINPDVFDGISEPYGLNIQYSVYTDWTQLLIENKYMLARAIQLQMAERVIEQVLTSTRSNIDERLTKDIRQLANFALEGSEAVPGIRRKLANEIRDVQRTLWPEPIIETMTLR